MYIDRSEIKGIAKRKLRHHVGQGFMIGLLTLIILGVMIFLAVLSWQQATHQIMHVDTLANRLLWPTSVHLGNTLAEMLLSLAADIVTASTSLGYLYWLRQKEPITQPFRLGLLGFSPRYFLLFILTYMTLSVINYFPLGLLPTAKGWFAALYLVLAVVIIIVGLGLSQVYYVAMDLRDSGHGNILAVLRISWQLMSGFKWQYFVLQLSFIGWNLLGALLLPQIWIVSYQQLTYAAFYEKLRDYKPELLPAR